MLKEVNFSKTAFVFFMTSEVKGYYVDNNACHEVYAYQFSCCYLDGFLQVKAYKLAETKSAKSHRQSE